MKKVTDSGTPIIFETPRTVSRPLSPIDETSSGPPILTARSPEASPTMISGSSVYSHMSAAARRICSQPTLYVRFHSENSQAPSYSTPRSFILHLPKRFHNTQLLILIVDAINAVKAGGRPARISVNIQKSRTCSLFFYHVSCRNHPENSIMTG